MSHDLNLEDLAVVSACLLVWGLFAARLERWNLTSPIAFLVVGLAVANGPWSFVTLHLHSSTIRSIAEVTLALLLFSDAARVNAKRLLADVAVPVRLLGIGLPLTIGIATGAAVVLFNGDGVWVAALLAAIVAPTDAALGASIMQDRRIPRGCGGSSTSRAGSNDGIATPFVNLFLAGVLSAESVRGTLDPHRGAPPRRRRSHRPRRRRRRRPPGRPLSRRRLGCRAFEPFVVLALALFAYAARRARRGERLRRRVRRRHGVRHDPPRRRDVAARVHRGERHAALPAGVVRVRRGHVGPGLRAVGWRDVVFALIALSVARMGPVAISLLGTGLDRATVAFIGWFGPRGLASVVFGLIAVDALDPDEPRSCWAR